MPRYGGAAIGRRGGEPDAARATRFRAKMVGAFAALALVFGVDPLDPLTFVSVPVVVLLTAIVADAPAWRASRINPADAFRHDG